MVYEDVHWIDPTSRELLELTIERLPRLAVLLLVTFRPEFRPPWIGQSHVTTMELSRLGQSDGAALVERIAGVGADLPGDIMEEIVERTDGVPLFLEELTKAVLETRATGHDARGTLSRMAPSASAVPTTLQASLLSRLDHLGPEAKEIAQVGAAIGREFTHELLSAVRQDEGELQRGLDRLVGASLLFQRGGPPNAVYAFKHALVQDTAYMTLLRGPRRELHARIAAVLEQEFPEISGTQPEVLAHHFAQAGSVGKAADYWHRAGRLALTRSAVPEAVAQLTKALAALDRMPDGPERQGRELDLQMTLGSALISAKGYAAPETGAAFARARELCQQVGDTATTFRVLYGEWAYLMVKGEVAAGYEVTEQFLHLAEQQGSSDLLVIGHRAVGANALVLGRLDSAEMHLQRALALYDPAEHKSLLALYAFDPRAIILAWLTLLDFLQGHAERAVLRSAEAVAAAREMAHPATLAYVLNHAIQLHQLIRDSAAVEELSGSLLELTDEHGFPFWAAAAKMQRGWLTTTLGQPETGAAAIREGLAAYRSTGSEHMVPYYLALRAEAHAACDQLDVALTLVEEALASVEQSGERWYEPELYRLKGDWLRTSANPDDVGAEACLVRASTIAHAQGAKSWELRAAISLARLWRDQGKRIEAHDLLEPVFGWPTNEFNTPDIADAKALLEELRG
jgi:predicted ATPase